MLRAFHSPLLAKVPYATLFGYNAVLQRVFEAPVEKVALSVELPGAPKADFTYGRLQEDIVAVADALVARREAVASARGDAALSWVQPSKPASVRSVFAQGERTPSCDYMKDNGHYTTALMAGPGYPFVVSLLASWATNQLTTPMSVSQRYDDELMYVLEHSGSRSIVGETKLLKEKFPREYEALYVRSLSDVAKVSEQSKASAESSKGEKGTTYRVESVVDTKMLISEISKNGVEERLCYDDSNLGTLNPLFRRWHSDPSSRPTKYDDCLMIYTSGTTARPKGAVHTHASVSNMVNVLRDAWEWSSNDCIIHMLPVHHVHGLVNILLCSLASHARCVSTKFDDPARIAHRIEAGDITLVMAVPTIYTKLIATVGKTFSGEEKAKFKSSCQENVRLMVSGSAALPVPTLNQFKELSGHTLLERYGMTEIGMALSQPLRPIASRVPGTVGSPLPTVSCVVYHPKKTEDAETTASEEQREKQYDEIGALAVASDSLFDRYWNNPSATKKELREGKDGQRLFDTGDTVGVTHGKLASESSVFTILGRSSIDIIKSRGYKLSALEIEAALLSRKDLFYEMAVVGSKDEVRGESVVAIIALQPDAAKERHVVYAEGTRSCESPELTQEMKKVSLELLAPYKCPERFIFVPEIPRNPTGKVNKKNLKKLLNLP